MSAALARIHSFFIKNRFELLEKPDPLRVENTLANARAFLSICCFFAIYVDPTEPSRFRDFAYFLLLAHEAYSLCLLLYAGSPSARSANLRIVQRHIHTADVGWAIVLTLFTDGPTTSPFFAFFLFALISAAYRWHVRETFLTMALLILMLLVETLLINADSTLFGPTRGFGDNRLIVRAAYLAIIGVLLGYLTEREKQQRTEIALVADIGRNIRSELGLTGAVHVTLESLIHVYDAHEVSLVMLDHRNSQVTEWRGYRRGNNPNISISENQTFGDVPPALSRPAAFQASIDFKEDWSLKINVFEPSAAISKKDGAKFIELAMGQIGPGLYSVFLVELLRSRAGALERARLARELHDGIIQSLISVEMRTEVLRRTVERGELVSIGALQNLQDLLHNEVLSLRELMQHMKPLEVGPKELLDFMAEHADRFRRDTGISTKFHTDLEEVALPPTVCQELARIVQELLANIRKHSGARNGLIRFGRHEGGWKLSVEDDGQGFPFSGRRTLAELDKTYQGPLIVKERVRAIGGDLVLESIPGKGSRIEITFFAKDHDRNYEAYSHSPR